MSWTTGSRAGSPSRSARTGWPTTTNSSGSSAVRRSSCGAYGRWARCTGSRDVRPTGWAIVAVLVFFVLHGLGAGPGPHRHPHRRGDPGRLAPTGAAARGDPARRCHAVTDLGGGRGRGRARGRSVAPPWVGALYEVGRRVLAATLIFQGGHFWLDDVAVPPWWLAGILLGAPVLVMLTTVASLRAIHMRPLAVQRRSRRRRPSLWLVVPLVVGLGGQFALLPFRDRLAVSGEDGGPPLLATLGALLTLSAIVGFVLVGPWLVAMVGRGVARLSRSVPSLLAARRIAENPQATFYSVAAVGLAAVALGLHRLHGRGQRPANRVGRAWTAVRRAAAPRRRVGHDRRRADERRSSRCSPRRRRVGSASCQHRRAVRRPGAGSLRHLSVPTGLRLRRAARRLRGRRHSSTSSTSPPTDHSRPRTGSAPRRRTSCRTRSSTPTATPSTTTWRRSSRTWTGSPRSPPCSC